MDDPGVGILKVILAFLQAFAEAFNKLMLALYDKGLDRIFGPRGGGANNQKDFKFGKQSVRELHKRNQPLVEYSLPDDDKNKYKELKDALDARGVSYAVEHRRGERTGNGIRKFIHRRGEGRELGSYIFLVDMVDQELAQHALKSVVGLESVSGKLATDPNADLNHNGIPDGQEFDNYKEDFDAQMEILNEGEFVPVASLDDKYIARSGKEIEVDNTFIDRLKTELGSREMHYTYCAADKRFSVIPTRVNEYNECLNSTIAYFDDDQQKTQPDSGRDVKPLDELPTQETSRPRDEDSPVKQQVNVEAPAVERIENAFNPQEPFEREVYIDPSENGGVGVKELSIAEQINRTVANSKDNPDLIAKCAKENQEFLNNDDLSLPDNGRDRPKE